MMELFARNTPNTEQSSSAGLPVRKTWTRPRPDLELRLRPQWGVIQQLRVFLDSPGYLLRGVCMHNLAQWKMWK